MNKVFPPFFWNWVWIVIMQGAKTVEVRHGKWPIFLKGLKKDKNMVRVEWGEALKEGPRKGAVMVMSHTRWSDNREPDELVDLGNEGVGRTDE